MREERRAGSRLAKKEEEKKKEREGGEVGSRKGGKKKKTVGLRASKRRNGTEEVEAPVDRAVADVGCAALPKLNWSDRKDAARIAADGPLRCASFADGAFLLRPS